MKQLQKILMSAALALHEKAPMPSVPRITQRDAKALLAYGDAQLLNAPLDVTQFALGRWLLGHYFTLQHRRRDNWTAWLQRDWPAVSPQAIAVWMDFAHRVPWREAACLSLVPGGKPGAKG